VTAEATPKDRSPAFFLPSSEALLKLARQSFTRLSFWRVLAGEMLLERIPWNEYTLGIPRGAALLQQRSVFQGCALPFLFYSLLYALPGRHPVRRSFTRRRKPLAKEALAAEAGPSPGWRRRLPYAKFPIMGNSPLPNLMRNNAQLNQFFYCALLRNFVYYL
jgi:hypothetical protein